MSVEKYMLYFLDATESAAIAAFDTIGKRDPILSDKAAVDAIRSSLNKIPFSGVVVIGEGERDAAPMLYNGEEVGLLKDSKNAPIFDIALDPLECTTACAFGFEGSMSVLAVSEEKGILRAPDIYMSKIVVGANIGDGIVDLDYDIRDNIKNIAAKRKIAINEVKVIILNRPRHKEIIDAAMSIGAKVSLIEDGDIAAAISVSMKDNVADMYVGIGGAPEGVLAAAVVRELGGYMECRLLPNNEDEEARVKKICTKSVDYKYRANDLISSSDFVFVATGITGNSLCPGIEVTQQSTVIHSFVVSSKSNRIYRIKRERKNFAI